MLDHLYEPAPDGANATTTLVLLHGRGSDMDDMAGLRPHLPDTVELVTVRAPFPAAPWGYGPGWAWYRYLGGTSPEPESFRQSLRAVEEFLDALPDLLPDIPDRLVLGGFSQGGTVSLAFALRHPSRLAGGANFSGFLADHPDVDTTAGHDAPPIFWGHGEMDPAIPFQFARSGWRELEEAGARLSAHSYHMGHGIDPDELRDFEAWLEALRPEEIRS